MGDDMGRAVGGAVSGPLDGAVWRKLSRAAAGYLDEGEELAVPAVPASRGGGIFALSGAAVLAATFIVLAAAGDRMGAAANWVFGAGLVLGMLLILMMLPFTSSYAVVLTGRRLLLFRMAKIGYTQHVRGIYLAVPRSEVSAAFKDRLGWAVLSLKFSPATGQAPMELWFMNVQKRGARYIYEALMTPTGGADASPQPGKAA